VHKFGTLNRTITLTRCRQTEGRDHLFCTTRWHGWCAGNGWLCSLGTIQTLTLDITLCLHVSDKWHFGQVNCPRPERGQGYTLQSVTWRQGCYEKKKADAILTTVVYDDAYFLFSRRLTSYLWRHLSNV